MPRVPRSSRRTSDGCSSGADWRELLARADIEAVVVATPPDVQPQIARAAILAGKHVLVEKPAGRTAPELEELAQALAAQRGVRVRVGFNLRYHRAFRQARQLVDSGELGPLMFLRARYGHGGRPAMTGSGARNRSVPGAGN